MLITFKASSYANITMFGDIGKKMLELMDYGNTIPGAIIAADVNNALRNLRRGLEKIPEVVEAAGEADDDQPAVSIHTRALPLIALLESAVAQECDVRWE